MKSTLLLFAWLMASTTDAVAQSPRADYQRHLLQLRNTVHSTFSDAAWDPPTDANRRARSAIAALSVSFFNRILRQAQSLLLSNPTNAFPEIYNFQSK